MKKLVSLILAAIMLMACSVAMADAPSFPANSKDLEGAPAFVDPISMKTKRRGDTVTVTLGDAVDSLKVLWYGVGEEFETLEVVDGVAKYNAANHRYQPGVTGKAMNLTRGTEWDFTINGVFYNTLGQQINASAYVDDASGNPVDITSYSGVRPPIDIVNTDDVALYPNLSWGAGYADDALYLTAQDTINGIPQFDNLGNPIMHDVTSYTEARDIIEEVIGSEDQYRYIDMYDYRVSGNADDPITGYARPAGQRVWYWTLEKAFYDHDNDPKTADKVVFRVLQPWGVKVDGAAYEVVVGSVAFYYDRAGKFICEKITVTDDDPFKVGVAAEETVYTYTKMVAKSNEAYWLSKIEAFYGEGDYTYVSESFYPNASKAWMTRTVQER
jgi:hypothetical protein